MEFAEFNLDPRLLKASWLGNLDPVQAATIPLALTGQMPACRDGTGKTAARSRCCSACLPPARPHKVRLDLGADTRVGVAGRGARPVLGGKRSGSIAVTRRALGARERAAPRRDIVIATPVDLDHVERRNVASQRLDARAGRSRPHADAGLQLTCATGTLAAGGTPQCLLRR
jgi:hypothetical protein